MDTRYRVICISVRLCWVSPFISNVVLLSSLHDEMLSLPLEIV